MSDETKLSVMIVGAQKSGTSALDDFLTAHPELQGTHQLGHAGSPEFSYFIHPEKFGHRPPWQTHFGDLTGAHLVGKSAGLMYDPEAVQRLYRHNPDVLVVVVMREPVSRAYSSFLFNRRRGIEPEPDFVTAITAGPARFAEGDARRRRCDYVSWSKYADFLPLLFDTFGKGAVFPLLFEELTVDPVGAVTPILDQLGVGTQGLPAGLPHSNPAAAARSVFLQSQLRPDHPVSRLMRRALPAMARNRLRGSLTALNTRPQAAAPEPLADDVVEALRKELAPSVRDLAALLERPDISQRWWGRAT